MEVSRLLALDLSGNVGWAFYETRRTPPVFDTFVLPRRVRLDIYGPTFACYEDWLISMLGRWRPNLLSFESPILPSLRMRQKQRAIRLTYGLAEITERIAFRRNLPCHEVHPITAKKRLTGNYRARKHHMILAAHRLGAEVATDHEADAIAVALVAMDFVDPPQHEMVLP